MTLSLDILQKTLPKQMKAKVTQSLLDKVNASLTDPNTAEMLRENIVGYSNVLKEGRFTFDNYISAVKYVSYKSMGDTNTAAYIKTFPQRYASFKANGTNDKDIASYITAYNKNKLVNLIFDQSLIPVHVLNAEVHQKAINHLLHLVGNAKSEKVQCDAATSLLTHLKRPETQKIELEVGVKDTSALDSLKQTTRELAAQQKKMIELGTYSAKDIIQTPLVIEGECS